MQNIDDDIVSNRSGNRPFQDVLRAYASRRSVLAGGLATAAAGFFGPGVALAGKDGDSNGRKPYRRRGRDLIGFEPVAIADGGGPEPSISRDYQFDIILPWGEPLEPGGPVYQAPNPLASAIELAQRAADQTLQIGIGHDAMWFFPLESKGEHGKNGPSNHRGMLALNHEFGGNAHVLGKEIPESLDEVRISQHAHGVSILKLERSKNSWRQVRSSNSRRIHVNSPVTFSGPAAGHALLDTPNGNVPLGTLNNCAHGVTPWGTYLTCEENFNGYFGASNRESSWSATDEQARYGFSNVGFGYGWHLFDRRFDLSDTDYVNEENRFGWVVEIDPFDGTQTPVKRTALGRMKHEGATITEDRNGRIVAYLGDDERFEYVYKFVSEDNWRQMRREGRSPLDHGILYVARFNDDGSAQWLPLTMDNADLAARFADIGELLSYTRIAADIVGGTKMDRPEWTAVAPNGDVYLTLTNNSRRTSDQVDAVNPLAPNPDGHIIRWREDGDFSATTFQWEIFLIAAATHGTEDTFGSPDGIWVDPDGRVFIQTDGAQKDGLNDQMLVADPDTADLRRLFTGVTGCEVTGITVTPDRRTLFVNVQHPGDGDPSLTSFPLPFDGVSVPRDATVVITRKDGGIVGS